jgi:hypothetical protein
MIGALLVCFRFGAALALLASPTWFEGLADFSVLRPEIFSHPAVSGSALILVSRAKTTSQQWTFR